LKIDGFRAVAHIQARHCQFDFISRTVCNETSGEVGDITAGRSLGPWTQEIADRIMALYERSWEQANLTWAERDAMRRELADDFRKRIEAKEPYYPYVEYPYLEWFSEKNGRVVLELDNSQLTVIDEGIPRREKTPGELAEDEEKRAKAMVQFLGKVADELTEQNRETGDDSGVTRCAGFMSLVRSFAPVAGREQGHEGGGSSRPGVLPPTQIESKITGYFFFEISF